MVASRHAVPIYIWPDDCAEKSVLTVKESKYSIRQLPLYILLSFRRTWQVNTFQVFGAVDYHRLQLDMHMKQVISHIYGHIFWLNSLTLSPWSYGSVLWESVT